MNRGQFLLFCPFYGSYSWAVIKFDAFSLLRGFFSLSISLPTTGCKFIGIGFFAVPIDVRFQFNVLLLYHISIRFTVFFFFARMFPMFFSYSLISDHPGLFWITLFVVIRTSNFIFSSLVPTFTLVLPSNLILMLFTYPYSVCNRHFGVIPLHLCLGFNMTSVPLSIMNLIGRCF